MTDVSASAAANSLAAPDPGQKRRVMVGAMIFVAGWVLSLALIPVVNDSALNDALKATLSGVLVLVVPKLFLLIAVAVMGKPGFVYLKSVLAGHFRRLAPPATVSLLRYRIGLILFVTPMLLGSLADYLVTQLIPMREQYPYLGAPTGDLMIVISLFVLGGDFWDKLRALFVRDAKVVFPSTGSVLP